MADYTLSAKITGDSSSFNKAFQTAKGNLEGVANKAKAAGDKIMGAGTKLTVGITAPLAGISAKIMKVGGDFEAQMSRVQAVSGAGGQALEQMKKQAIDLGAKTAFSAKEAAEGMENLASAGFDANEIMAAIPGILDMAAVSGGDVGLAAENAGTALRGFGLDASNAGHVADVFARAAADTNAEAKDMGDAMKYVAPIAHSMGLSIEETAAAIGIMSDAGIKGSQAGTALRGALARLAKPTDAMSDKMAELGLSFYDSEGKMKPLKEQISMLKGSFKGLSDEQKQNALVTLYGQESLSGMMALIDKGPDALGEMTDSLINSDGAASEMAKTMQNNMNSAIEQMFGAFESLAIVVQDIVGPTITQLANGVSDLVQKFLDAPKNIQVLILSIAGVAMAIGPVLIAIGAFVKGFGMLATIVGLIASPVGLAVVAIIGLGVAFGIAMAKSETFRSKVISVAKQVMGSFVTLKDGIKSIFSGDLIGGAIQLSQILPPGVVQGIVTSFQTIKAVVSTVWDGIQNFIQGFKNGFSGMAGTAGPEIMKIVSFIMMFTSPLSFVIGLVRNFGSQFSNAFSSIGSEIVPLLGNLGQTLGNLAGSIIPMLTSAIGSLMPIIGQVVTTVFQIIQSVLPVVIGLINQLLPIISQIIQVIVQIATALAPIIAQLISALLPVITQIVQTIMNIVQAVAPAVIAIIQAIMSIIQAILPVLMMIISVVVNIVTVVVSVVGTILTVVGNVIASIMSIVSPIISFIAGIISAIFATISPIIAFVSGIFQTVFSVISGVFNSVLNFIGSIFNGIGSIISGISAVVSGVFNAIFGTISNIMNRVGSTISGVFRGIQNAWTGLSGFVSGIFNGISGAVSSLVGQVKGFVNGVIGGVNSAISIINKIPGVNIGVIPQLQSGTSSFSGGLARMNEGGRGEMVLLPSGSQVIPHDASMRYAEESARINNRNSENNVFSMQDNSGVIKWLEKIYEKNQDVYMSDERVGALVAGSVNRKIGERTSFDERWN